MRALFLNRTLKPSPQESDTERLASVVAEALEAEGIDVSTIRVVDHDVRPGVTSDEGDGDEWPSIHDRILEADILVLTTPTWIGQPTRRRGRGRRRCTGRAAARNLLATARALAASPIPARPS